MYKNLIYEGKCGIAYITINRPNALNALNQELLGELYSAFGEAADDDQTKAVIITGSGKAFVAGADIAEMNNLSAIEGKALVTRGHALMNFIESIDKPVIAAINGFALGGGCELAMACDIRIASEKAKFGQPEANLGIIPGFGGTQRLPRLVGAGMAKYLIMTAEIISADEACRIGLVEKAVPAEQLLEAAEVVARTIMEKAPIAIATTKTIINTGLNLDILTASKLEIEAFTAPFGSDDKREGMTAFIEKRPAKFTNK